MDETDMIETENESLTVTIKRFERDGEKLAVIRLDTPEGTQTSHSYCDKEEIINRAYYRAMTDVGRRISNAGLPGDDKS